MLDRDLRLRGILRSVLAAGTGILLIWGIVTTGLSSQSGRVKSSQLLAAFGTAKYPDIAALRAEQLYADKQYRNATSVARSAILNDPLNARAMRVLGLSLDISGDHQRGGAILRQAGALGWRDTPTMLWGMRDAAERNDVVRVLEIADALGRRQVAGDLVRAIFFASLTDAELRNAFVERLAYRPSWRPTFFNDVATRLAPSQVEGMALVLRQLASTSAPATPDETLKYVGRLTQLGEFGQARAFWSRAFGIPPEQLAAFPFDGNFARISRKAAETSTSPFEWQVNPDLDGNVAFSNDPKNAVLRIDPGIASGAVVMSQIVMLSPGSHQIRTQIVSGTGAMSPVAWTINCLPSKQSILRTLPRGGDDEISLVGVVIPTQGCPAQELKMVAVDRLEVQPVAIAGISIH